MNELSVAWWINERKPNMKMEREILPYEEGYRNGWKAGKREARQTELFWINCLILISVLLMAITSVQIIKAAALV